MIYYLIENENGFETLVFEGTEEEARREKIRFEENCDSGAPEDKEPWPRTTYYILPETEWTKPIGCMH